jgi:predicted AlkP superfamily phosphohydrolase/phosphomutase
VKGSAACLLAATLTAGLACSSAPPGAFTQKLVVLGFDGFDPDYVAGWIEEGKLPHLASLAERGGLHRLQTTANADGAPAWASFATGVNPGKHRIFDSFARDPRTYALGLAAVRRSPARFLFDYFQLSQPTTIGQRGGTSFWVTAGRAGVRSSVLSVPITFPPEKVPNGELLAGSPLPDVSGATATYHYFASDLPDDDHAQRSELGGLTQRLSFRSRRAEAELFGPTNPVGRHAEHRELRLPFVVNWNHEERSATIELNGEVIHLLERQWSRWVDVEFKINVMTSVRGMAQFYLITAGQALRLYVSPVQWNPAAAPAPMSSPPSFARELHDRLGPYRTLGFPATAWAFAEGHLDREALVEDIDRAFDDQAETILNRVDARNWDLLVGVIDATDHLQHALWRNSAVERMYRRADEFVGELLRHLDADTTVMVVSAHGFRAFESAVNLNSWLVERGYMTLLPQAPRRMTLHDLSANGPFWTNVDWSRTHAYAVGNGQLFVNLKGREPGGLVSEGSEYEQLLDSLIIDLMNFLDPRTQARVVARVFKRAEIYSGPFVDEAADLLVAFERGFRISWQSSLGGTPQQSVEANTTKWSGDHGSGDHTNLEGLLITNRKPTGDTLRVVDIAPSVLAYFGLPVPSELDGRAFY